MTEVETQAEAPEEELSVEEMIDADPLGSALLDRVELFTAVLGAVSTAVCLIVAQWPTTFGFGTGWLVCQLNVAVLRRAVRLIISSGVGAKAGSLVLLFKQTFLMVGCWMILTRTEASVMAFAVGFGVTVTGLVVGSVICAPRSSPGGG